MTDRRELPASGPVEPDRDPAGRRRSPWPATALVMGTVLLVGGLAAWSRGWLADREEYRFAFAAIELIPPPPPWIAAGAPGLLERVRVIAGRPEAESALALDLKQLADDFKRSPWVEQVVQVRTLPPNKVVVRLHYREPVALIPMGQAWLVLDDEAVVLPGPELDRSTAGPLIEIVGLRPTEAAEGRELRATADSGPTAAEGSEPARAAARLAAFVRAKERGPNRPGFRVVKIVIRGDDKLAGLWLWLMVRRDGRTLRVLWGRAGGASDEPDDDARWSALVRWSDDPDGLVVDDPERQWLAVWQGRVERFPRPEPR